MKIKITFISALFITSSLFLKAQSGSLDLSFGNNGIVTTDIGTAIVRARSFAIQNDGKIVVVGDFGNGSNDDIFVIRYNSNGSLDSTFDTDGKVTTAIGTSNDYATSIAIQSDGKIVVAGYSANGTNNDFAVVRYNANGGLDTSFDIDGKVTTAIGTGTYTGASSVAIQTDGKIVLAGYSFNGTKDDFAVIRYNSNGSLDSSFDTDGKVTTTIGTADAIASSVTIQSDGKIVLAGYSFNGTNKVFAAVRYNSNGSLDTSFDTDGKVTTAIGSGNDQANSSAIQNDGKIVVAGYSGNSSFKDITVIRYNSDGSLDSSFDTDGKVVTGIGTSNSYANSVVIQSDGKIVVAGYSGNGTNNDIAVVRHNPNGSLDTSFDTDGKVTTSTGTGNDIANSAAIQSNGKIVLAGYSNRGVVVIRYDSNGLLDTSFDTDGKVTTAVGSGNDHANSVAIQNDGKIVVAGYSVNGSINDFAITRYNANGLSDNTFGANGKVTTVIGTGNDIANSVAIQNDGKIVVVGQSSNGINYDFAITRYSANGSLDTSFDTDGKLTTAIGSGNDQANSVAIQNDGKIVVAGQSLNGSNYDFAITRYNANGSLDTSFDNDGKVTTAIGTGNDIAYSVAIQTDGKIVVAGYTGTGVNSDFAVIRYNTNGSLDNSFDNDGIVTTAIGTTSDIAYSVAIQSDGKIVVAGYTGIVINSDFAVTRYNANGSLDTSFDMDGKVTTAIGTGTDIANSVAIQNDGKIVVTGYSSNGANNDFAVTRYNANGSLDTGFDTDGIVTTDIGSNSDLAKSVAIQNDGKIVVVGYYKYNNSANEDFVLVRYNNTTVGIENLVTDSPIVSLYPNPTNGAIYINFAKQMDIVTINIKNILGQTISTKKFTSTNTALLNIEGASGLYFVEIQTANKTTAMKVQKN